MNDQEVDASDERRVGGVRADLVAAEADTGIADVHSVADCWNIAVRNTDSTYPYLLVGKDLRGLSRQYVHCRGRKIETLTEHTENCIRRSKEAIEKFI